MPTNTGVISRLRHIMEVRQLSQRRLASLLRMDPSNLSKILTGKLPVSEGLINRAVVDLGISKRWLTTGCGIPFEKSPIAGEIPVGDALDRLQPAPAGTPVYDLDVTAGCRSLESVFGRVHPVGAVAIPGVDPDSAIVRVCGDSMAPRITNGGYVAIRPVGDTRIIFWGQIYVVELDDYRMVKYLRRHPDPGMVVLHSDNPAYDDMDILLSDIRALYLVEAILNYEPRI